MSQIVANPAADAAWDVFTVERDGDEVSEIQRVENTVAFLNDLEAVGYVYLRAIDGDQRSIDALRECYGRFDVPITTFEITDIVRDSYRSVRVEFAETRHASKFEVELHALRDNA